MGAWNAWAVIEMPDGCAVDVWLRGGGGGGGGGKEPRAELSVWAAAVPSCKRTTLVLWYTLPPPAGPSCCDRKLSLKFWPWEREREREGERKERHFFKSGGRRKRNRVEEGKQESAKTARIKAGRSTFRRLFDSNVCIYIYIYIYIFILQEERLCCCDRLNVMARKGS